MSRAFLEVPTGFFKPLLDPGTAGSEKSEFRPPSYFYTYLYNHAHRLRLEKRLYLGPSKSSNGFLKLLLDPDGGFGYPKPPNGGFGREITKHLTAIYLTEIPQRTQVSVRV